MVGKLTAVLIRKEAEAYRSQGLHEEAFALYDELLASSPNIDEALRSDIQTQMDAIAEEMEAFSNHEDDKLLSSKEIRQLKNGWDKDASATDMLVSAHDLCQIGAYQDALIELTKLLNAGMSSDNLAEAVAECFTNLYDAKKAPPAAEKWLRSVYSEGKKVLAAHLQIIKVLSRHTDKTYAMHYCRYVGSKNGIPADLKKRLEVATVKFKTAAKDAKRNMDTRSIRMGRKHSRAAVAADSEMKVERAAKSGNNGYETDINNTSSQFIAGPMEMDENNLKAIFTDVPDDDFIDDPPPVRRNKERLYLHFFKIIFLGWFNRAFSFFLPKRRSKKEFR